MWLALAPGALPDAGAFTATLAKGPPTIIYLQVGVGSFTPAGSTYTGTNGTTVGTPAANPTINKVFTTLTTAVVGNGVAQPMATDSTASNSFYDNFAFCSVPTQLYIGGFYRTAGNGPKGSINVTATVPASLTDAAGDTIPFSQISWTSGGNGDTTGNGFLPEVFPGGTFVGGAVQTVGTIGHNQWAQSCWTFSYKNTVTPAAGTYTGRVLFTMTLP
ncbi:MAG TPA: hypothetical protein VKB72_06190 [Steroidobacteraceae bacterium]|nr:hypothetical protein [Steroidobacteraceae bacterium]